MIKHPDPVSEINQPAFKSLIQLVIVAASGLILYYFIFNHESASRVFMAAVITCISGVSLLMTLFTPQVSLYDEYVLVSLNFMERRQVFYYDISHIEQSGNKIFVYELNATRTTINTSGWKKSSRTFVKNYIATKIPAGKSV